MVWIGLLGPLSVRAGTQTVVVPAGKQRIVLATLALRANQVVSLDELIDTTWDGAPPPAAAATLRNYVRRLRHVLGGPTAGPLRTQRPGYSLQLSPEELDVTQFEELCRQAEAALHAPDWHRVRELLDRALGLWRGTPLSDIGCQALHRRHVDVLEQQRLLALEWRVEANLRLGEVGQAIPRLRALTAAHPLHERFHAQLMVALALGGRPSEALTAYQTARTVLTEELGVEPGPELQRIHAGLLAADTAPGPAGRAAVPRQLPAVTPHFTGRVAQCAVLSGLAAAGAGGVVVVSAIGGAPGIGKTALALHWAHQHVDRFPDGQLYVNLGGFGPAGGPLPVGQAIRGFLDALHVPAAGIPADPQAQAALYRSHLAGRRVLVVLDNARDAEQVRPLLPGSAGCLTLVTSRDSLAGLVALDGAHPITLDVLSHAEARELFTRRLGARTVEHQEPAARELADLAGRLPLALNLTAARAILQPGRPLATLAAELRDLRQRLDILPAGDASADPRAVFSWSYRALPPDAARVFRLLSAHPGHDVSLPAAASTAGLDPARIRHLLATLAEAHLISERPRDRYAFHDLIRAYALELTERHDDAADRRESLHRLLDHYLRTATAARRMLYPVWLPVEHPEAAPGVTARTFTDREAALAWYQDEHPALVAVVGRAAEAGFDRHAWQVVWAVTSFLELRGHAQDWAAITEIALAAAERAEDPVGTAFAHHSFGSALTALGRFTAGHDHLGKALTRWRRLGNRTAEGYTHIALARSFARQQRFADALEHARLAHDEFAAAADPGGQAQALNAAGWYEAHLGRCADALASCRRALVLARRIGHQHVEAAALDSMGFAYRALRRYAEAAEHYERSLRVLRDIGDRYLQAETLTCLGDNHDDAGEPAAARAAWQQSLEILDELRHPTAGALRLRLRAGAPR